MIFRAAARYMKKSKNFVRKWLNRYKEARNIDNLPDRIETRVTTEKKDKVMAKFLERTLIYLYFVPNSKSFRQKSNECKPEDNRTLF